MSKFFRCKDTNYFAVGKVFLDNFRAIFRNNDKMSLFLPNIPKMVDLMLDAEIVEESDIVVLRSETGIA